MSRLIRIATRGSALALAQTQLVGNALRQQAGVEIEVVTISTAGDRDRVSPLWTMSGTGFFTTQVEQALLEGAADVAVHSFKDLPTEMTPGLTIAAVPPRARPEDVMVASGEANSLETLPYGATVGTSSPRRTALLRHARPDLNIQLIRGNVETRLSKVASGQYDATVLARAGLDRLGLSENISCVLDADGFVPAPAQGALAVQCRSDDAALQALLKQIDHRPTAIAVGAERRVLSALHPGCHAPVGIHAILADATLAVTAFVADVMAARVIKESARGPADDAGAVADILIEKLMTAGVEKILEGYQAE